MNFESMRFPDMDARGFYEYVKERILPDRRMYLFFDEVQRIKGWENAVNSFRVDFDCDIYISGSNACLLSSELSTYLSGRYVEIKVLPLSFRAFLDFHGYVITDPILLREIILFLADNIGNNTSETSIGNTLMNEGLPEDSNLRYRSLSLFIFTLRSLTRGFLSSTIVKKLIVKNYTEMRVRGMTKEDKKNAYLYCKFRDEQFAMYDAYAKRHGMLMKTLLVVNVLFYAPDGLTQRDICGKTFQSKQSVNLVVKNLLADGYVTVTEIPENKRTKVVRMTESGRAYCEEVVRHITWAEDTAMSMFTVDEQKQLVELSRTFTHNLEKLIKNESEEMKLIKNESEEI